MDPKKICIIFRTGLAMLPIELDKVQIDVAPGLALPAEAADFIFNRLHWISEGETGPFEIGAPDGWDFSDLCTLAFLISNQEYLLAQGMVETLLRLPSILLPSASLVEGNNNHLKKKPFRGRLKHCGKLSKQKRGLETNGSVVGKAGAGDANAEVALKSQHC